MVFVEVDEVFPVVAETSSVVFFSSLVSSLAGGSLFSTSWALASGQRESNNKNVASDTSCERCWGRMFFSFQKLGVRVDQRDWSLGSDDCTHKTQMRILSQSAAR